MSEKPAGGTLYLVGTPVGNLEDISARAARVLGEVDLIAAEDTRQARKLLSHLGLHKPLVSYHQHSREARYDDLYRSFEEGRDVALVTDAGMPGVSDPGAALVAGAVARGFPVVPIPGPTALVLALAASGLPTASFLFDGFLPRKSGARRRRLAALGQAGVTIVIYESPHRVVAALEDIAASLGDPPVAVGREMTKLHEEFLRGKASEVAATLKARQEKNGRLLGEFTVVIGYGSRKARKDRTGAGEASTPAGEGGGA